MSCNLTDAEWKLMHRLWEQSPQTITQLTAALSAETGWEKHTVITMLTRLEAKGAVRHEEGAREREALLAWAAALPGTLDVLHQRYMNQKNSPPELLAVRRRP